MLGLPHRTCDIIPYVFAGDVSGMPGRSRNTEVPGGLVLAAEYIRMSTEHQQYSIENQHDAIQRYADSKGIRVVHSFVDAGKSGVGIQGRDALQDLLRVVESGEAGFTTILVYDVSRWGRFQEPDEGAYYEFRCIRANITIQYCAEQFPTDNAPMSAVLKSLKRAMAGEYSRELSTKVFAGQCRLITLGFRQGGTPGYGFRRLLVDQFGNHKGLLTRGNRKSFQLDRVILAPGPTEEIAIVRRVYEMFVSAQQSEALIAQTLNTEAVATESGRPWTRGAVHEILTNEKYIGNNVYNRTSTKLQQPRVINRPEDWVRRNGAFTPLIDEETFAAAQRIIDERDRHYTDDELIALLRDLYRRLGKLSGVIIDESEGIPSAATYRHRFDSLRRAYELVGYAPERDYSYLAINKALRLFHGEQIRTIISELSGVGAVVRQDPVTGLLAINDEFTASLVLSRCRDQGGTDYRWVIRFDVSLDPDITIAARLDVTNAAILDYYLFPSVDVLSYHCSLAPDNGVVLDVYRTKDLSPLCHLAQQAQLPEVA